MSREFHLISRERPSAEGFLTALRDAGGAGTPEIDGDFGNPNAYLNVAGDGLWIELDPPGHVEAADLDDTCPPGTALPEPDSDLCLWLTIASIPAGAPAGSAGIARRALEDLAADCQGVVIEP